MVLCVGYMGRLGAVGLRAAARPGFSISQARCLSTFGFQRPRAILARSELRAIQQNPRSFWSSSKPAAPVEKAEPAPARVEEAAVPEANAATEPLPTEPAAAVDATSPVPSPEAALPPVSVPTDVLPTELAASIPPAPLHYGDLAALGLAGWTPAGICRWGMELIQVSTGMPWFWTIISATVLSRVFLFPFTVKQMQSTAALAPHQAEIAAIKDEMTLAQKKRDTLAMQRAALRQKMIYEKAGVSLGGMALAPFIQLPVTLGMFFGVKKLCDLPLEQLKYSGFEWVPDLTVADPTWTLPILATVLMNVQITVSMRDMIGATPQMGHIMNFLRVLTTGSVFLMANLSSGVIVYLITGIVMMTLQSLILRQPIVRRMLGIPLIPAHLRQSPPSMMDSLRYARKWWNDKAADVKASQRR
ncbi:60Kd inner membrane protein-domain-containing protein [Cubamyces lactineus]|nr:60Kd inner membrane protein-domain-containing protein [Cubamyces lactineus]